ncbi:MAG TPA: DUF4082 domain-containing protein, partial [Verrucomicrobiota bacterium]|nr:DUF4082 domain-containing protein [Verrucomicrobiota bacterium]
VAYDEERQQVVLFGGRTETAFTNQTWVWQRDQYSRLTLANSPPVRLAPGMVFDGTREQVILFGGHKWAAGPHWDDTWAWTGANWVELIPASRPPGRRGQGMMFDSVRQTVVLFGGGGDGGLLCDTWLWDGQNWNQAMPATSPPASIYHGMTFQAHLGKGVLFGLGHSSVPAELRTSTWSWDGTTWMLERPSQSPPARYIPALAYDATREQTVLFGGQTSDGGYYEDTWLWDGNDWTRASPQHSPPARHGASMTFDPIIQRVVLFGGSDDYHQFNDTWLWDGNGWTEWLPGAIPTPPQIIQITVQPPTHPLKPGESATVTVTATGTEPLHYQWYLGETGDTSAPVLNATTAAYTTGPLFGTTSCWVRVSNVAGTEDSQTVTIALGTEDRPAVVLTGTEPLGGSQYPQTVGWRFKVSAPIVATSLGVFDADADGLTASQEVGIWDSHGSLLVSATVPSGTSPELSTDFRWIGISPVILTPGTYHIGAYHAQGATDPYPASASIVQAPEIVWTNPCYAHGASLAFPDVAQSSSGSEHASHFGPNLRFHVFELREGGFEMPDIPYDAHAYNPEGSAWRFNRWSGIVHPSPGDSTPVFDAPAASEGEQAAFLQCEAEVGEIAQDIVLPATGLYELSYLVAGRRADSPARPYDGNLAYVVQLDGVGIGSDATVSFQPFTGKTFTFQATAGSHSLSFVATGTSGDHVAFFDAVTLVPRRMPAIIVRSGAFTAEGAFEFTFHAEPGQTHRVQYSDDLKTWNDLTQVVATVQGVKVSDPGAASRPSRFYRALTP